MRSHTWQAHFWQRCHQAVRARVCGMSQRRALLYIQAFDRIVGCLWPRQRQCSSGSTAYQRAAVIVCRSTFRTRVDGILSSLWRLLPKHLNCTVVVSNFCSHNPLSLALEPFEVSVELELMSLV